MVIYTVGPVVRVARGGGAVEGDLWGTYNLRFENTEPPSVQQEVVFLKAQMISESEIRIVGWGKILHAGIYYQR